MGIKGEFGSRGIAEDLREGVFGAVKDEGVEDGDWIEVLALGGMEDGEIDGECVSTLRGTVAKDGSTVACDVTLSGENDWGIYGVGGNVREWTSEMDGQSIGHPRSDVVHVCRVLRGASWTGSGDDLRCAYRSIGHPRGCIDDVGFRVVMRKSGWDLLPPFKQDLQSWDAVHYRIVVKPARHGTYISEQIQVSNPVRVRNPNHFTVAVGIRAGSKGMNFHIGANGDETVYIPEGRYDIYFVFPDKPDAHFRGNAFTLNNSSFEIKIMLDVDGKTPSNYKIRQVK